MRSKGRWRAAATVAGAAALVITALGLGTGVAHASGCTGTDTSDQYTCTFGSYEVDNNIWNDDGAGDNNGGGQTMSATSASNWSVSADFDATDQGTDGSIISYPETIYNVNGTSGEDFQKLGNITSSFNTTLPKNPGTDDSYEAAYDIWLGGDPSGAGSSTRYEVMIWTDNYDQHWGGSSAGSWTDPTTGTEYDIYDNSTTMWFVPLTNPGGAASGSVDIADALCEAYCSTANGGLGWAKSSTLYQVDYGFEISDTSGTAETFTVNDYSLDLSTTTAPTVDTYIAAGSYVRVTGTSPVYLWDWNDGNTNWHVPDGAVLGYLEDAGLAGGTGSEQSGGIQVISQAQYDDLDGSNLTEWDNAVTGTFLEAAGSGKVYLWDGSELYHIPSPAVLSQLENEGVNGGSGPSTVPSQSYLMGLGPVIS